jgi:formylglycine-generating enzyme required for sulfatase activity
MRRYVKATLPVLVVLALCLALQPVPTELDGAPSPMRDRTFTNSIGMKFVLIPQGKFLMGSPKDKRYHRDDELPQHEVQITKAFYLGVYEVTQKQYRAIMGINPSFFSATGDGSSEIRGLDTDNFPVERVSWNDAERFCTKLSALPAERMARCMYRLPTEAEWEYACRAGTKTPFNTGTALTTEQANFDGRVISGLVMRGSRLGRTARVGSYTPNAFGVYDMHGNVWEWCQDLYEKDYSKSLVVKDPIGPDWSPGDFRVIRGGAFNIGFSACRSAARSRDTTDHIEHSIGLRLVCITLSRPR